MKAIFRFCKPGKPLDNFVTKKAGQLDTFLNKRCSSTDPLKKTSKCICNKKQ